MKPKYILRTTVLFVICVIMSTYTVMASVTPSNTATYCLSEATKIDVTSVAETTVYDFWIGQTVTYPLSPSLASVFTASSNPTHCPFSTYQLLYGGSVWTDTANGKSFAFSASGLAITPGTAGFEGITDSNNFKLRVVSNGNTVCSGGTGCTGDSYSCPDGSGGTTTCTRTSHQPCCNPHSYTPASYSTNIDSGVFRIFVKDCSHENGVDVIQTSGPTGTRTKRDSEHTNTHKAVQYVSVHTGTSATV